MNDSQTTHDIEMDRIVQALETAPAVNVPDDFAARLMARLPAQPERRYVVPQTLPSQSHVGRTLALAAMLVLIAAMLLLAPHTAGSETRMLLQGVLFVQLTALLLWMGISYKRLL